MNFPKEAAKTAYDMIEDGMVISLGNGPCINELARLLSESPKEVAITTTCRPTKRLCREYGFKIIDSRFLEHVDLAFDTCDEIDAQFNLQKSVSGFHTRARILAAMADTFVVFADSSKFCPHLLLRHSICLEVLQPALSVVIQAMKNRGASVHVRENAGNRNLAQSEDGNYLVNAKIRFAGDLDELDQELNSLPGVVDHSLFCHMADVVITATKEEIKVLHKTGSSLLKEPF